MRRASPPSRAQSLRGVLLFTVVALFALVNWYYLVNTPNKVARASRALNSKKVHPRVEYQLAHPQEQHAERSKPAPQTTHKSGRNTKNTQESAYTGSTKVETIEQLMTTLVEGFKKAPTVGTTTPQPAIIRTHLQHYITEYLPGFHTVSHLFRGRGIVFLAGGTYTFPQAMLTMMFIRTYLNCQLPIEIWRLSTEEPPTPQLKRVMQTHNIVDRAFPKELSVRTTNKYTFKPYAILFSSFEEVLFFDSDAIPIRNPEYLFNLLTDPLHAEPTNNPKMDDTPLADVSFLRGPTSGKVSAVFWPDFWTLLNDSNIWGAVGGFPNKTGPIYPAQESGVMLIDKTGMGWKPLCLCTFMNYHYELYYHAIYDGGNVVHFHTSHGAGDKDTFQIAWYTLNVPYRIMRAPAVVGPFPDPQYLEVDGIVDAQNRVCGAAFGQHDARRRLAVLHHNANKWKYEDWIAGNLPELALELSAELVNENDSNNADGWDDRTSAEIASYGRKGVNWCVMYRAPTTQKLLKTAVGYEVENAIRGVLERTYNTTWMKEFIDTVAAKRNQGE